MNHNVSVFKKSRNVKIVNSLLTVEVGAVKPAQTIQHDKLDLLLDGVSLNAILNAGGRADEVRCYPGTRKEVIEKVEKWMDGQDDPKHRILWLRGHAGAGKSAISQTLAERRVERGMPSANFFFRGDNTRNHSRPLVATLVYQLMKLYPNFREHLIDSLSAQPLAHKASVREQFTELLASPVKKISHSSSINRAIVLIIDGLDECDDKQEQEKILAALLSLVSEDGSPFRVFIASRAEHHLLRFFNGIKDSASFVFLNDEYGTEDDIRMFVTAKFEDIKRTHHLADTLGEHWPTQGDIERIVAKSSGQFIYAATVLRFIEYSKDNPSLNLRIVHQLRPPISDSPFVQLDVLYSHVLSKARDMKAIKCGLWLAILPVPFRFYIGKLKNTMDYEEAEIMSLWSDISSIARFSFDHSATLCVEFYHASFPDYLKDKSRSRIYHVNEYKTARELAIYYLQRCQQTASLSSIGDMITFVGKPTTKLSQILLDASHRQWHLGECETDWARFIERIIFKYFENDRPMFRRIVSAWIRFAYIHDINPAINPENTSKFVYMYYNFLRATEKTKFVCRRAFNR